MPLPIFVSPSLPLIAPPKFRLEFAATLMTAVCESVTGPSQLFVPPLEETAPGFEDELLSVSGSAVTLTSPLPPSGGAIGTIANQAALESSKDGTASGSVLAGATLTLIFHCLNGAAVTNATGNGSAPASAGSDAITASISKPMSVITPVLWPMFGTSFPIQVTSSQRVEY